MNFMTEIVPEIAVDHPVIAVIIILVFIAFIAGK